MNRSTSCTVLMISMFCAGCATEDRIPTQKAAGRQSGVVLDSGDKKAIRLIWDNTKDGECSFDSDFLNELAQTRSKVALAVLTQGVTHPDVKTRVVCLHLIHDCFCTRPVLGGGTDHVASAVLPYLGVRSKAGPNKALQTDGASPRR